MLIKVAVECLKGLNEEYLDVQLLAFQKYFTAFKTKLHAIDHAGQSMQNNT
ncbi:hypothetical protein [Nitrosomonas aestuarii]|uniref:hypothetical protein n=1 Tax=Nitrosomonas aestuarii TaxID=52441 RepID=UPI000D4BCDFB|nr:hypothetical protein [Nitrosomonas aestuarii]PTN12410.1 hypothetical protein C8R11_104195 [Nitrosomonas aestuarii]